jgi:hypothetical protein
MGTLLDVRQFWAHCHPPHPAQLTDQPPQRRHPPIIKPTKMPKLKELSLSQGESHRPLIENQDSSFPTSQTKTKETKIHPKNQQQQDWFESVSYICGYRR